MKLNKKHILPLMIWLLLILVIIKFIPYFWNTIPLWYDPWFYRGLFLEYFQNIPHIDYQNISTRIKWMYEPFLWYFSNILQLLWYSVDFLLSFWLVFFSIITSTFIYLVLKSYNKQTAIIWVFLFLMSIIQYQAFAQAYYKQIIWIIFILWSIYFIEKKQYILLMPALIWALTIQRPTWVFLTLAIVIYIIWNYLLKRKISKGLVIWASISWIIALIMYFPLRNYIITPFFYPLLNTALEDTANTGWWAFFDKYIFIRYTLPYLLLAIYGFYLRIKDKIFDMIDAWIIVGILRSWLQLYFYNRMLIFTDLFLILLAARTLNNIVTKYKKIWLRILWIFFIYQTMHYSIYLFKNHSPIIPEAEFTFLTNLKKELPENSIMMVSNRHYTPRSIWYINKATIAPWLLDRDPRTKEQRIQRWIWDGEVKCNLLTESNLWKENNIYLWIWSVQNIEDLSNWDCFKLIYMWDSYSLFNINFNLNDK